MAFALLFRSHSYGTLAVAVALFCTPGARVVAQTDINPSPTVINPSPPGYKEYLAILGTPLGSLPPLTTYTLAGLAQRTPEIQARYGYVSDMALPLAPDSGGHHAHSLSAFALTGLLPLDLGGTISLTLGVANQECTGCTGARFMGSVAFDSRILSTALGDANASRFALAVNGEIGAGNPATGTSWTAAVGFPLSFAAGNESGTRLIPFLTPGLTFVTTSGSNAANEIHSLRAITSGGVALFNAKSNLGASAGIQYIFVPKTQVLIGVGLSWGGR